MQRRGRNLSPLQIRLRPRHCVIARPHVSCGHEARRIVPANTSYRTNIPRKRYDMLIVVDAEELLEHRAGKIILVVDHHGRAVQPRENLSFFIARVWKNSNRLGNLLDEGVHRLDSFHCIETEAPSTWRIDRMIRSSSFITNYNITSVSFSNFNKSASNVEHKSCSKITTRI